MLTSRADACFHQDLIKKMRLKVISHVGLRKYGGKAAPLAQTRAFYPDLTAHGLRQQLSDRQTNAGASKGARTRLVDAVEAFEDMGELFWLALVCNTAQVRGVGSITPSSKPFERSNRGAQFVRHVTNDLQATTASARAVNRVPRNSSRICWLASTIIIAAGWVWRTRKSWAGTTSAPVQR